MVVSAHSSVTERVPARFHGDLDAPSSRRHGDGLLGIGVHVLRVAHEHGHRLVLASPGDESLGVDLDVIRTRVAEEEDSPPEGWLQTHIVRRHRSTGSHVGTQQSRPCRTARHEAPHRFFPGVAA
jgi:hypothetical protein